LANYDVSPDGQRFLMIKPSEQESAATQVNVVLNWSDELRRLVPTGKTMTLNAGSTVGPLHRTDPRA
jgi:hypothetical protein